MSEARVLELRILLNDLMGDLEARPEAARLPDLPERDPAALPLRLEPRERPERRMLERGVGSRPRSSLNWGSVELARALWMQGKTQQEIASLLGVGPGTVGCVLRNKTWAVPDDLVWWERPAKEPLLP